MTTLDDLQQIRKLDKEKMANLIADVPNQCLRAYQQSQKINIQYPISGIQNLVVCGMGGSAIGGDLVKTLLNEQLAIPFLVIRNWQLPNFVNQNSLVFVVSYSGNTQETLECFQQAQKKKAKIIAITSGGQLKKLSKESKIPVFDFDFKAPPRASLGYLSIPILVILEKIGLVNLDFFKIEKSLKLLDQFNQQFLPEIKTEKNIAKYLAYFCFDHLPLIIASSEFAPVARRWKNQFNENSKSFAFYEEMPEIFHNLVEGEFPQRLEDEIVILFLEDPIDKSNSKKSLSGFKKLLEQKNIRYESVPVFGDNFFIKLFSLVILGDWVSFYLAMLNNVNPTPVEQIEWLKKQLL